MSRELSSRIRSTAIGAAALILIVSSFAGGREAVLVMQVHSQQPGRPMTITRPPDGVVRRPSGEQVFSWYCRLTGIMGSVAVRGDQIVLRRSLLWYARVADEYPSTWLLRLAILVSMAVVLREMLNVRRARHR